MVAYCQTTQFIRLIMTVQILSVMQNQIVHIVGLQVPESEINLPFSFR